MTARIHLTIGLLDPNALDTDRRIQRRQAIDQIKTLAAHLPDDQRLLIDAYFSAGRPMAQIARGLRTSPQSLRRRLHRIVNRMSEPEFEFVATNAPGWPPRIARVTTQLIVAGESMRTVARRTGLSFHAVRTIREVARHLHLAHNAQLTLF